MLDKNKLGQVFTPEFIVDKMLNLISKANPNLILETSSGSGNFYFKLIKKYKNVVGIEIDEKIAHKGAIIDSYFNTNYKADVIIGNPPYVKFNNIENRPESKLLIHKPNLFHYFLEKALKDLTENGELIWIVPSNIFTNTSGKNLNKIINENFSITHWEQVKENIWHDASIPTAIIKIIKAKNHPEKIDYIFSEGKIIFGSFIKSDQKIIIKVGGASGFNSYLEKGDTEFIDSTTERTKLTKFIKYEPQKWIRPVPKSPENFTYTIFVNCKTRKINPFYILERIPYGMFVNYDASVLCIYTFSSKNQAKDLCNKLNSHDWELAGIKKDGRYHFSQSILKAIIKQN
ncbi:Eco57I restriction-modification methylase domain-containing protein [Mycoplasma leonicaptivi]|uniref:Eco57I restriction-modification methylase domain-containing protein n=1 Tax=Mycoplasma leonicaptivi TaxID=36742 RepID=UPI0004820C87|nr:Eco57I restriction-modification methylase domain-containing protein [Mycoplasma leonicaptivi]